MTLKLEPSPKTVSGTPFSPFRPRALLLAALALGLAACASDKPTGPPAAAEVKIMDTVFLPPTVIIDTGQTIEWINRSREHRTVTSGRGPTDALAGDIFDVDLAGYRPGEPDGEHYRRAFTEPDTIHYFSRLAPAGFGETISGTIIIR